MLQIQFQIFNRKKLQNSLKLGVIDFGYLFFILIQEIVHFDWLYVDKIYKISKTVASSKRYYIWHLSLLQKLITLMAIKKNLPFLQDNT